MVIDEQQWQRFSIDGFLQLGRVLTGPELEALRGRADDLAAGKVVGEGVVMALEHAEEPPAAVADTDEPGAVGYRQIQGLEHDDAVAALRERCRGHEACKARPDDDDIRPVDLVQLR